MSDQGFAQHQLQNVTRPHVLGHSAEVVGRHARFLSEATKKPFISYSVAFPLVLALLGGAVLVLYMWYQKHQQVLANRRQMAREFTRHFTAMPNQDSLMKRKNEHLEALRLLKKMLEENPANQDLRGELRKTLDSLYHVENLIYQATGNPGAQVQISAAHPLVENAEIPFRRSSMRTKYTSTLDGAAECSHRTASSVSSSTASRFDMWSPSSHPTAGSLAAFQIVDGRLEPQTLSNDIESQPLASASQAARIASLELSLMRSFEMMKRKHSYDAACGVNFGKKAKVSEPEVGLLQPRVKDKASQTEADVDEQHQTATQRSGVVSDSGILGLAFTSLLAGVYPPRSSVEQSGHSQVLPDGQTSTDMLITEEPQIFADFAGGVSYYDTTSAGAVPYYTGNSPGEQGQGDPPEIGIAFAGAKDVYRGESRPSTSGTMPYVKSEEVGHADWGHDSQTIHSGAIPYVGSEEVGHATWGPDSQTISSGTIPYVGSEEVGHANWDVSPMVAEEHGDLSHHDIVMAEGQQDLASPTLSESALYELTHTDETKGIGYYLRKLCYKCGRSSKAPIEEDETSEVLTTAEDESQHVTIVNPLFVPHNRDQGASEGLSQAAAELAGQADSFYEQHSMESSSSSLPMRVSYEEGGLVAGRDSPELGAVGQHDTAPPSMETSPNLGEIATESRLEESFCVCPSGALDGSGPDPALYADGQLQLLCNICGKPKLGYLQHQCVCQACGKRIFKTWKYCECPETQDGDHEGPPQASGGPTASGDEGESDTAHKDSSTQTSLWGTWGPQGPYEPNVPEELGKEQATFSKNLGRSRALQEAVRLEGPTPSVYVEGGKPADGISSQHKVQESGEERVAVKEDKPKTWMLKVSKSGRLEGVSRVDYTLDAVNSGELSDASDIAVSQTGNIGRTRQVYSESSSGQQTPAAQTLGHRLSITSVPEDEAYMHRTGSWGRELDNVLESQTGIILPTRQMSSESSSGQQTPGHRQSVTSLPEEEAYMHRTSSWGRELNEGVLDLQTGNISATTQVSSESSSGQQTPGHRLSITSVPEEEAYMHRTSSWGRELDEGVLESTGNISPTRQVSSESSSGQQTPAAQTPGHRLSTISVPEEEAYMHRTSSWGRELDGGVLETEVAVPLSSTTETPKGAAYSDHASPRGSKLNEGVLETFEDDVPSSPTSAIVPSSPTSAIVHHQMAQLASKEPEMDAVYLAMVADEVTSFHGETSYGMAPLISSTDESPDQLHIRYLVPQEDGTAQLERILVNDLSVESRNALEAQHEIDANDDAPEEVLLRLLEEPLRSPTPEEHSPDTETPTTPHAAAEELLGILKGVTDHHRGASHNKSEIDPDESLGGSHAPQSSGRQKVSSFSGEEVVDEMEPNGEQTGNSAEALLTTAQSPPSQPSDTGLDYSGDISDTSTRSRKFVANKQRVEEDVPIGSSRISDLRNASASSEHTDIASDCEVSPPILHDIAHQLCRGSVSSRIQIPTTKAGQQPRQLPTYNRMAAGYPVSISVPDDAVEGSSDRPKVSVQRVQNPASKGRPQAALKEPDAGGPPVDLRDICDSHRTQRLEAKLDSHGLELVPSASRVDRKQDCFSLMKEAILEHKLLELESLIADTQNEKQPDLEEVLSTDTDENAFSGVPGTTSLVIPSARYRELLLGKSSLSRGMENTNRRRRKKKRLATRKPWRSDHKYDSELTETFSKHQFARAKAVRRLQRKLLDEMENTPPLRCLPTLSKADWLKILDSKSITCCPRRGLYKQTRPSYDPQLERRMLVKRKIAYGNVQL